MASWGKLHLEAHVLPVCIFNHFFLYRVNGHDAPTSPSATNVEMFEEKKSSEDTEKTSRSGTAV